MTETKTATNPDAPLALSTGTVARKLGVSSSTVRRWARIGVMEHHVTPGGSLRFSESTIRRVLQEGYGRS